MAESPVDPFDELTRWCAALRNRLAQDPDEMIGAEDQLTIENHIAAGIAVLAGEPPPLPSLVSTSRPVMTKDMLITADLVRRSLIQHNSR